MPVIDMCIGNDVHELARLHIDALRDHTQQYRILHDVPVIRRQYILGALIQDCIQRQFIMTRLLRDIERHTVRAGIEIHLHKVGVNVNVRHNAAAERIVRKIIKNTVNLPVTGSI